MYIGQGKEREEGKNLNISDIVIYVPFPWVSFADNSQRPVKILCHCAARWISCFRITSKVCPRMSFLCLSRVSLAPVPSYAKSAPFSLS